MAKLPNFPIGNDNDATAIAMLLGGEAISSQRIIVSQAAVYGLDLTTLKNPVTLEKLNEKTGPLYAAIQVFVPDADAPDDNGRLIVFSEHPQWRFDSTIVEDIPDRDSNAVLDITHKTAWVNYLRTNGRLLGHLSSYEVRTWQNLKNFRFAPVSDTNYNIEVRVVFYG